MLKKLTKKQEELIPVIRDKWLNAFYNAPKVKYSTVKPKIEWLYKFCGKKKPEVIIMDSPMGCQVAINTLKKMSERHKICSDISEIIERGIREYHENNLHSDTYFNERLKIRRMGADLNHKIANNISKVIRDGLPSLDVGRNADRDIHQKIKLNIWSTFIDALFQINRDVGENIKKDVGAELETKIQDPILNNILSELSHNALKIISTAISGTVLQGIINNQDISGDIKEAAQDIAGNVAKRIHGKIPSNLLDSIDIDPWYQIFNTIEGFIKDKIKDKIVINHKSINDNIVNNIAGMGSNMREALYKSLDAHIIFKIFCEIEWGLTEFTNNINDDIKDLLTSTWSSINNSISDNIRELMDPKMSGALHKNISDTPWVKIYWEVERILNGLTNNIKDDIEDAVDVEMKDFPASEISNIIWGKISDTIFYPVKNKTINDNIADDILIEIQKLRNTLYSGVGCNVGSDAYLGIAKDVLSLIRNAMISNDLEIKKNIEDNIRLEIRKFRDILYENVGDKIASDPHWEAWDGLVGSINTVVDNINFNIKENIREDVDNRIDDMALNNVIGDVQDKIDMVVYSLVAHKILDNVWSNISGAPVGQIKGDVAEDINGENIANDINGPMRKLMDDLWHIGLVNMHSTPIGDILKKIKYYLEGHDYQLSANSGIDETINFNEQSCYYVNCSDYGWVAFWDYFQNCGYDFNYDWSDFDKYKSLLQEGIYEIYPFDNVCIICCMPKVKQDDRNRLHCEDGPAVSFDDGFSMYYWHGVHIPEKWVKDRDSITKEDITGEENAEKRRCLQEILGGEKFVSLLGCIKIDSDTDNQGNVMNLWRTEEPDSIINKHIYYYDCICPSTSRRYFLCVPECPNVWAAKASTFNNKKIEIRHGDVGLININNQINLPIFES